MYTINILLAVTAYLARVTMWHLWT